MVKDVCAEAINVVQCLMGKASHYNPFALCERIGISTITDKPLQKDGYLVCSDGLKLIFVSSNIQNQHRRTIILLLKCFCASFREGQFVSSGKRS